MSFRGWAFPFGAEEAHWYDEDGDSLCGEAAVRMYHPRIDCDVHFEEDCVLCGKLLRSLRRAELDFLEGALA